MKANVPEKIFLYPYSTDGIYEVETKPLEGNIEYTRNDVFIEKVCRWIKENITNNPNANSVLVRNGCVTLAMLIEDFKKSMEE